MVLLIIVVIVILKGHKSQENPASVQVHVADNTSHGSPRKVPVPNVIRQDKQGHYPARSIESNVISSKPKALLAMIYHLLHRKKALQLSIHQRLGDLADAFNCCFRAKHDIKYPRWFRCCSCRRSTCICIISTSLAILERWTRAKSPLWRLAMFSGSSKKSAAKLSALCPIQTSLLIPVVAKMIN